MLDYRHKLSYHRKLVIGCARSASDNIENGSIAVFRVGPSGIVTANSASFEGKSGDDTIME